MAQLSWTMLHPLMTIGHLGLIPSFLDDDDLRPAAEQIDANYKHGGGWRPQDGWTVDSYNGVARYPGDPPCHPVAITMLREERIFFYVDSWLCIMQPSGDFQVGRVD